MALGDIKGHPALLVAFALLSVTLLLQIIGLATNYWMAVDRDFVDFSVNIGLWKQCMCVQDCLCLSTGDEFMAGKVFELLAMTGIVLTMVLVTMVQQCGQNSIALRWARLIVAILTDLFIFIGVIAFVVERDTSKPRYQAYPLGYSFWLCIITGSVMFLVSLVFGIDLCVARRRQPIKRRKDLPAWQNGAKSSPGITQK